MIFVACSQQEKQNRETSNNFLAQSEKEDLLQRAQALFQPLPAIAENSDNPVTTEKVKLGQRLFFDTRLSKTGNNSCNSCHNLNTYGVDNLPTSKGDAGKFGERNSPTVLNAALHVAQFWDGRAIDVEEQAGGPILNPVEMDIPSKDFLVNKLNGVDEYVALFKAAFPGEEDPVTYPNIQKSIAAFERKLVTPSPFDDYLKGDLTALNDEQKEGLKAYLDAGCTQCHSGIAIGGSLFQKFGIYGDYRDFTHSKINDEGKKKVTKAAGDKDFFKVPSLRNIDKTYPYFHDGSIAELNEAVKIMAKVQLNKDLSDQEVKSIIAFLGSLTGTIPAELKSAPERLAYK